MMNFDAYFVINFSTTCIIISSDCCFNLININEIEFELHMSATFCNNPDIVYFSSKR